MRQAAEELRARATTRRAEVGARAPIGDGHPVALEGVRGHRDDAQAVGRGADRVRTDGGCESIVAGRCNHGGACSACGIDRRLECRRAGPETAEAEVDDPGRRRIDRDTERRPGHAARGRGAGGPADGIGDIGDVPLALAEHAHRQDLGLVGDTRQADAVVTDRSDHACHGRTVPRARRDGAACEHRQRRIGCRDPVTRIGRIGVPTVTVVGDPESRIGVGADEVVAALQHIGVEVRVRGDAGVEHGDRDPGTTGAVPGGRQIDATATRAAVALQVPEDLAHVVEQFIVRQQRPPRHRVDLDRGDRRVGAQGLQESRHLTRRQRRLQADDMGQTGGRMAVLERPPERAGELKQRGVSLLARRQSTGSRFSSEAQDQPGRDRSSHRSGDRLRAGRIGL